MLTPASVPLAGDAAAVVAALAAAGTTTMFGVPGGGPNLDVVGAAEAAGLRFVLTRSETAAAIMAATTADLTGAPGAVLVTRGPGLASAVNGIAHAALDRLPLVVIADTVRAAAAGRISHQRLDLAALGRSVAKDVLIAGGDQAGQAAARAVALAQAGPAGPVLLLLDGTAPAGDGVGSDDGDPAVAAAAGSGPSRQDRDRDRLIQALSGSRRPVLLLGAGAIGHTEAIRAAVCGRGVPALHTYRARGIVPDTAAEAAGLVTGGTMEWPLLAAADLIVGLGLDEAEMIPAGWDYPAPVLLAGHHPPAGGGYFTGAEVLAVPVGQAAGLLAAWTPPGGPGWAPAAGRAARQATAGALALAARAEPGLLAPQQVAAVARAHTPDSVITTVDAGAHMLAVMPLWDVPGPRQLLISSGLATMGFALPAAIAAALARPGQRVLACTGDGGLGMTLAEIETAVRLDLPVTVLVFNDAALSLIKIKQRPAGQGGGEAVDYGPVSFAAAAAAMGAAAESASDPAGLAGALAAALARPGPTVIDVAVDPAGYPAIMDLSRGDAARRAVPGLTVPGPGRGSTETAQTAAAEAKERAPWR